MTQVRDTPFYVSASGHCWLRVISRTGSHWSHEESQSKSQCAEDVYQLSLATTMLHNNNNKKPQNLKGIQQEAFIAHLTGVGSSSLAQICPIILWQVLR